MLSDKKVNLFIVGAAKAGTTSLYSHLASHPEICTGKIKEPNYFSAEAIKEDKLYYDEPIVDSVEKYNQLFSPGVNQQIIAEASVSYLFYQGMAKKIYEYNPDAKIIIMLRNPAERAFSHYLMDKKLGYTKYSFDEIINNGLLEAKMKAYYQQYIAYGLYAKQVKAYLETFSASQVMIILFESMLNDFTAVLQGTSEFLKLKTPLMLMPVENRNEGNMPANKWIASIYQNRAARKFFIKTLPAGLMPFLKKTLLVKPDLQLSKEQRIKLNNIYREDLKNLESLINKKLMHWYEE